ncbi:unnamed protein product [Arabis nemorensis]|uniref:Uncharacterized protein n=1 Tax=Arabis nemorensis TaxID=586526 RepID=A0A565CH47_9BRAS|nr:unnamed protein product [Arabis nemorensis]
MNPSTDQASIAVDELAPPSQPHRLSTSCDLHPDERFSGFCPSCLCERLSVLDHTSAAPPPSSSSRKPPNISASTLKALFKPSSSSNNNNANGRVRPGFFPELRRTKSFSAKNNEGFSGGFEPQRRSCDVRLRDEHRNIPTREAPTVVVSGAIIGRHTQSEIADYGYGRRSSDTDPRFSLDAGRFSVDIGRISLDDSRFDEPRASWDGHLTGKPATRIPPPKSMLSAVENAPVNRSDPINGESDPIIIIPGGSTQTRDYYTEHPPSRRRKSVDRSNSIKKTEIEEFKSVSNSKVSPAITERDDYSIETGENKKSRRWGKWSILGFIYRKGVNKEADEEDMYSRSNSTGMVERSLSESWPEMRNEPKMRRSNSNVSWRSSGGGSSRNNGMLRRRLELIVTATL